jgi:hypothetical protein
MRLVVDAGRSGPMFPLGTSTSTEWTWRSAHRPGGTLPAGYACELVKGGPPDRNCGVEPLLTLRYAVDGLNLDGTVRPGRQAVDVTVGHAPLTATPAIPCPTIEYSLDDGATWHAAAVADRGHGTFRAVFAATKAGGPVALRVTAADAAGSRIRETVRSAYRVVAS